MTNRILTLTVLTVGLLWTAGPSNAADNSSTAKTIQALYNRQDAAASQKDPKGTLAYVSPQFKGVTEKGRTVTYDEVVQQMTQFFGMAKSVKSVTKVGGCKAVGNKATVSATDSMTIVIPAQGHEMTLVDQSTSSDTWVKTSAGWRLTYSKILKHNTTVNGQPAPQLP